MSPKRRHTSQAELDSLLSLTYDQIPYEELHEDTLAALARGQDPYIAGSALSQLSLDAPSLAGTVAAELLESRTTDAQLERSAIQVLAQANPSKLVALLRRLAQRFDDDSIAVVAHEAFADRTLLDAAFVEVRKRLHESPDNPKLLEALSRLEEYGTRLGAE